MLVLSDVKWFRGLFPKGAGGEGDGLIILDEDLIFGLQLILFMMETTPSIPANDHLAYMSYALSLAHQSPPKPTNYRVGAILLDASTNTILTTGYTLECEGNTHAEQSCFLKLAKKHGLTEDQIPSVLPRGAVLYTTVEPCFKRLSGNLPCVQRILALGKGGEGIRTVYVGVKEPEKFVGENTGRKQLEDAGIKVILVEGLETQILEVATAGHVPERGGNS